jgi:CheY-like chemotaxis protein
MGLAPLPSLWGRLEHRGLATAPSRSGSEILFTDSWSFAPILASIDARDGLTCGVRKEMILGSMESEGTIGGHWGCLLVSLTLFLGLWCVLPPSTIAAPAASAGETAQRFLVPSPQVRPRILVAEDNAVNQRVVQQMLRRAGYDVTLVANGREAVEASACESFTAILMDVQMPEMNGLEATREIRAREATTGQRLPVIALTAPAMVGDREKCLETVMDDYVAKPVQRANLLEVVSRCLAAQ